jgi:hypothetical protein
MPRMCTASYLLDLMKEEDNSYLADAEVDVEFAAGVDEGLQQSGIVFYFKPQGDWVTLPPRQPERWVGHFDFEGTLTAGWPRDTGNARVCLHDLNLSHKRPHPAHHSSSDNAWRCCGAQRRSASAASRLSSIKPGERSTFVDPSRVRSSTRTS